jgi:pimeloyl-ACP methyl ester carboxylesterase
LRAPTMLLHSLDFGLVRDDQIAAYEAALGDLLEVVTVRGGHMVYWDAYDYTAAAVTRFLEDPGS